MIKRLFSSAVLLGLSSLISRLLGVLRANQMADVFGTGNEINAYFAAFALPDFIYSVLVYAAISSAFVPLFLELKKQDRWKFTSAILDGVVLLTGIFAAVIFIFAPQFIVLLYSGFDSTTQNLTVELVRILCLSPILFSISSVFMSLQTALGRFGAYAFAPIFYNLAIIFGVVYFRDIKMVAWCTVIGAGLHALLNLTAGLVFGFRYKFAFFSEFHHLRKFLRLATPRIFASMGYQINLLVDASIASLVTVGSLATLRFAQDINSFPLGIFGLSIATASFGILGKIFLSGDTVHFTGKIRSTLAKLWFFIIPSAVGLILVRYEITSALLQYGNFTPEDTHIVANTLAFLAIGLIGAATVPLLNRVFYSMQITRIPLIATLIAITLNIILDLMLYQSWGIYGLAFASSVAITLQMIYLFFSLHDRYRLSLFFPFYTLIEICISAGVMALAVIATADYFPTDIYLRLFTTSALGALVYAALSYLLGTYRVMKK